MWYIAAFAGLVVAGALAGAVRSKGIDLTREGLLDLVIDAGSIKALSMDQINFLLSRLESEEPPEPVSGAMCYAPVATAFTAEYICPVCGEKTIYHGGQSHFLQWQIDGARRLAESIDASTDFSVILDESQFCDFCTRDDQASPSLLLRIMSDQGTEVVNPVILNDLRMLDSFLKGNLYWITLNDGQEPLREHAERIAELLGVQEPEE